MGHRSDYDYLVDDLAVGGAANVTEEELHLLRGASGEERRGVDRAQGHDALGARVKLPESRHVPVRVLAAGFDARFGVRDRHGAHGGVVEAR